MAVTEKVDNPFNATERYLFVPVPAETDRLPTDGFVGDVMRRLPFASVALSQIMREGGFGFGEVRVAENPSRLWSLPYKIAFAAIHLERSQGWQEAPLGVLEALDALPKLPDGERTVATAGIPGTGLSGLRGDANVKAIRAVLEAHPLEVTVYVRHEDGEREPRVRVEPLDSESALLSV